MHLIGWSTICQPRKEGGLGIGYLDTKNEALLAKWWWRFYKEKNGLWRKILVGKYGADCLNTLREAWKNKLKINASPVIKSVIMIFDACFSSCCSWQNIKWELGNGVTIEFWIDNWHRQGVLKERLNLLFTRVRDPSLSVSQIVNCSSWEEIIDVSSLSSREEVSQLEYLKQIVNEVVLQDKEDRIIWVANNNCLTSAAVYQRLTEFSHNNRSWSQIWCMKIPPRIKVFLWQAEHNRLPTYDLLKRRSVRFENLCKWCNAEEETQAHLFFQCSLAKMGVGMFKQMARSKQLAGWSHKFLREFPTDTRSLQTCKWKHMFSLYVLVNMDCSQRINF